MPLRQTDIRYPDSRDRDIASGNLLSSVEVCLIVRNRAGVGHRESRALSAPTSTPRSLGVIGSRRRDVSQEYCAEHPYVDPHLEGR